MRFTRVGQYEVVTRVTGPHHHLLGLRLARGGTNLVPAVEDVSAEGPTDDTGRVRHEGGVSDQVVRGVTTANERLGTDYGVEAIRYCSSDPPVQGVYESLADRLVEYVSRRDGEAAVPATPGARDESR